MRPDPALYLALNGSPDQIEARFAFAGHGVKIGQHARRQQKKDLLPVKLRAANSFPFGGPFARFCCFFPRTLQVSPP